MFYIFTVIPIQFEVVGQNPSVQIFVEESYPENEIGVSYLMEYEIKAEFEKKQLIDNRLELILPKDNTMQVVLSWYSSVEMNHKKFGRLYLFPGDILEIEISKNDIGLFEINFDGSNAEGHKQLSKFQEFLPRYYLEEMNGIQYSDYTTYIVKTINFFESHTLELVDLLEEGLIDHLYHKVVTDYIHSIFCRYIISGFFRDRESIGRDIDYASKIKIADFIIDHFNYGVPNDSTFKSFDFAHNRIAVHRYFHLREFGLVDYSESERMELYHKGRNYSIAAKYVPIFREEDEFLRQFLFAVTLHFEFSTFIGSGFEGSRDILYAYFKAKYPWSRYLPMIEEERKNNFERSFDLTGVAAVKPEESYRYFEGWKPQIVDTEGKMKNFNFQTEIHGHHNTIEEIDLNDGKYYVKIWASWCAPCLESFAMNFQTDSLLDSYGIERLYISIDDPQGRGSSWSKIVEDYNLGGYHVIAYPELNHFLLGKIGLGSALLIPQYFIIIDGEIAVNPAPSPGSMGELSQILDGINSKNH